MNGQELRDARITLGWSRGELARRAGVSQYLIDQIERGRRQPTDDEMKSLSEVLLDQVTEVLNESGEVPIVQADEDGVTPTWNGLQRGDEVRISGERGRFKFLYYHHDDKQSFVQVFGPIPGTVPRSRNPRAAHERSVRPERVASVT